MRFQLERFRRWVCGIDSANKEESSYGLLTYLIEREYWVDVRERIETRQGKKEFQRCSVVKHLIEHDAPSYLLAEIVERYPEQAKVTDPFGNTPLHYMCLNRGRMLLSPRVVRLFLDAHPDGAKAANDRGQLPLHIAASNRAPLESLEILLSAHPEGAAKKCYAKFVHPFHDDVTESASGLPIHYLAGSASPGRREDVAKVKALLLPILNDDEACNFIPPPPANSLGTPLHIAARFDALPLRTYISKRRCPPDVIMTVATRHPEELRVRDASDGNLPLHVVAANAGLNGAESWVSDSKGVSGSGGDDWIITWSYVGPGSIIKTISRKPNPNVKIKRAKKVKKDLIGELVKLYPEAATSINGERRYPLSLAIESGKKWHQGIEEIADAAEGAIAIRDEVVNLYPFMLAATVDDPCITTVYSLLRRCPELERYAFDGNVHV